MDHKLSVLLTRPVGQIEPLRTRLEANRRCCIAFPALAIGPPDDDAGLSAAFDRLADFALVIFVSPNAIEYALKKLVKPWPPGVAIGVMGPGSRAHLAAHGIDAASTSIFSPAPGHGSRFDSEALFATFDMQALAGKRCLVVRGNGGRPWLIDELAGHGVDVTSVEAYRRSMGVPDASARAAVGQLIEKDDEAHLIVTSSEAVGMLKNLVQDAYGDAGLVWLLKQSMLVTHARIAENATSAGFAAVHRCEPGDDALVRALEYLP